MEEGAYDVSDHQLEYEAVASQRSIAISLKRIADALAPEGGQDIGTTLWYIEQLKRGRIDP